MNIDASAGTWVEGKSGHVRVWSGWVFEGGIGQFVTQTPLGQNEPGMLGVGFDFFAQFQNHGVHGAIGGLGIHAPDFLQKGGPGNGLAAEPCEKGKDLKFPGRQMDAMGFHTLQIHRDLTESQLPALGPESL